MIMVLYGEDTYRLQQKRQEIERRFQEKFDPSSLNRDRFSYSEQTREAILQAVSAPPFLGSRRMVVVDGLMESVTRKADAQEWAGRLGGRGEETIVVLTDAGLSAEKGAKSKLLTELQALDETIHLYAFGWLSSQELVRWAAQWTREHQMHWHEDALRALCERVGPDTWQLRTELERLSALQSPVDRACVLAQVEERLEDRLFALLDAVRQQRRAQALELLASELRRGTEPAQLIAMLGRDIQLLVDVHALLKGGSTPQSDVARVLGVHPFVVKKLLPQAMGIEDQVLQRFVRAALLADERLKTSATDDRGIVEMLVLDLVGVAP